jgi:enterochelin esterase family protein
VSEQIPDPALRALVEALEADAAADQTGRARVRAYLHTLHAAGRHAPVVVDDVATFLYLGRPNTHVHVALTGEWNGWDRTAWMLPAGRSGLYWRVEHLDPAARVEYQFRVNGRVKGDPLNPHQGVHEDFGPKSALLMPAYQPPSEITPRPGVPAGQVIEHTLHSLELHQARPLFVYLPPGYTADQPGGYPLVLFHDGGDYLTHAHAATVLDNSIADGVVPPLIAVFAPPVHRTQEYSATSDPYLRFCTEELPAFLRAQYAVAADPRRWATMGASLGGLIAVYLAWRRPDVFGWALPRSGAFSLASDWLIGRIEETEPVPVGFHCVTGLYDRWGLDCLDAQRRFVAMLARTGYAHAAAEYPAGHNWAFWAAHIQDGLAWALGRTA